MISSLGSLIPDSLKPRFRESQPNEPCDCHGARVESDKADCPRSPRSSREFPRPGPTSAKPSSPGDTVEIPTTTSPRPKIRCRFGNCGKAYLNRSSLSRHSNIHKVDKKQSHFCRFHCGAHFTRGDNRKTHEEKCHKLHSPSSISKDSGNQLK